jgi:AcrR family transcriptional regulator
MKAEDEDKVLETGEPALGEIDGPQIVVASPVGPNAQPSKQEHKAQARLRREGPSWSTAKRPARNPSAHRAVSRSARATCASWPRIPPRTRILSAAAELFPRYGIAGVSVEAIAKAAATTKPTLYNHFVSKDELVAEYLRESGKRLDVCWAEISLPGSAGALVQLRTRLAEMADGLVDGWACRLTNAAAELKEKSHPARRVIKTYNALQRRRLTRLCRAAGLRNPSMLADALLLLFDGACVMAPSVGRIGLSSRFLLLSEAMIAAHAKAPSARRQVQHP